MKKTQSKSKFQNMCDWLDAEHANTCESVVCIYRALTFDDSHPNFGYVIDHTAGGWCLHGHNEDLHLTECERKAMVDFLDQTSDLGSVLLQHDFEQACLAIKES